MEVPQERVSKKLAELRRRNMLALFEASGAPSFAKWLRDNGELDYNYANQIRNGHKQIADKWRIKLEQALRLRPGALDDPNLVVVDAKGERIAVHCKPYSASEESAVYQLAEKVAEYGASGRLTEDQARPLLDLLETMVRGNAASD